MEIKKHLEKISKLINKNSYCWKCDSYCNYEYDFNQKTITFYCFLCKSDVLVINYENEKIIWKNGDENE